MIWQSTTRVFIVEQTVLESRSKPKGAGVVVDHWALGGQAPPTPPSGVMGLAWDDKSTDIVLSWLKSQTGNVVYAYDPIHWSKTLFLGICLYFLVTSTEQVASKTTIYFSSCTMVQPIKSGFDIRPRTSIENVISCNMLIIPLLIYVGSGIHFVRAVWKLYYGRKGLNNSKYMYVYIRIKSIKLFYV